jgi:hypothetical protein
MRLFCLQQEQDFTKKMEMKEDLTNYTPPGVNYFS